MAAGKTKGINKLGSIETPWIGREESLPTGSTLITSKMSKESTVKGKKLQQLGSLTTPWINRMDSEDNVTPCHILDPKQLQKEDENLNQRRPTHVIKELEEEMNEVLINSDRADIKVDAFLEIPD